MTTTARRNRRGTGRIAALATLLLLAGVAPVEAADVRLARGTWVSIKGSFTDANVFEADEVERLDDHDIEIKGDPTAWDPATRVLEFGAIRLTLDDRTRVRDDAGNELTEADLSVGRRMKVSLATEDGQIRVRRVRLLEGDSADRLRIDGRISSAPTPIADAVVFDILGVSVRVDNRTNWDGVARPILQFDDDDYRPEDGIQLGKLGRFSGEFRFDFKGERNFDLSDDFDSSIDTRRFRTRLELVFPSTRRLSGMIQVKYQDEDDVRDEADLFDRREDLELGRTYLTVHDLIGGRASVQVGRSQFWDRRQWLYNRDVDALRFFVDLRRLHFEASISEELVGPPQNQDDITNRHLSATWLPSGSHAITAYVFDRDDAFIREDGQNRDFSPTLYGIRAAGEGKRLWSYWLEAALARGTVRGEPLDGEAIDAGGTIVLPYEHEPSFTLGYAFGSGDDDPFDGVNHTFRQSGLELNNGKWNGVTSFRYYGELMRPELANLHISTIGTGFRFLRKSSIDIVFHRYKLDELASEMIDSDVEDRRLNLRSRDIGTEIDLVLGIEEMKHFEFEVNVSRFEPGDAFLGPTDPAWMTRLKVKYVF